MLASAQLAAFLKYLLLCGPVKNEQPSVLPVGHSVSVALSEIKWPLQLNITAELQKALSFAWGRHFYSVICIY